MRERPPRRRFVSVITALMLAGLVFAPAATSQGNPHGTPPGQVGKNSGKGSSASGSPSSIPPGQAKKQGSSTSAASSVPVAPVVQKTTSTVTSKVVQSTTAKGNPSPPGQVKKAGKNATSTVATTSKVPPGQAKKALAVTKTVVAPVSTTVIPASQAAPAIPAATPTPATAAPAPAPATESPAASTNGRRPAVRRSSAQRQSATHRRAGSAGRSSAAAGTTTAARRRAAARRVAALTAAGAAGAATAGHSAAKTTHRSGPTAPRQVGHKHTAGPITNLIHNLIPVPLPVPDWSKPIILALLLICALLAIRAWMTSRRAYRIDAQRRLLAADLESLQPALVPEIPASFGPLAVSVAYRPADGPAAGGDFYDVFSVGGGRVAMILGDVSGHGAHALTRAAHMRYTLRAYMETGLDPRSALKLAGRVLGADEDALFTTVAVAVYDRSTSTMTYATAGHPPPIMLGPAAHRPLSIASPALGWGEPSGRRQTTVPFAEGAQACFFTDGVTEVRVRDGLLGREQLMDEVEQSGSAAELLERVQRRARSIRDDMAACIAEARVGTAISEVRVEEFEVHMRHLEAGQGKRFLSESGVSAENANSTLAHARLIAAESGSALLRVEMTDDVATASAGGSAPVSLATPPNFTTADPWASETSAFS
jgi:hypothetical protein